MSIRDALTVFQDLPVWLTSLLVALLTSFITEVVTNTATCTLVLPIIAQLVITINSQCLLTLKQIFVRRFLIQIILFEYFCCCFCVTITSQ